MTTITKKTIDQVLEEHSDKLMEIPGVIGTGRGVSDGMPCIVVMVATPALEGESKIPGHLEGYPVEIRVTGELNAS